MRHVVARDDHVQPGQPLLAHDGVHDLLEAAARRGGADADREARRPYRVVHELERAGPRRRRRRHEPLVALRLVVLQVVDERHALLEGRGRRPAAPAGHGRPLLRRLREVVLHLGLAAADGVLELVVVRHAPLDGRARRLEAERREGLVVREPVQLLGLDEDAVAVEEERGVEREPPRGPPATPPSRRRHEPERRREQRRRE